MFLGLAGFSQDVHGATLTAVADGPWSSPFTWGGTAPQNDDNRIIPTGITVTMEQSDGGSAVTNNGHIKNHGQIIFIMFSETEFINSGVIDNHGTITIECVTLFGGDICGYTEGGIFNNYGSFINNNEAPIGLNGGTINNYATIANNGVGSFVNFGGVINNNGGDITSTSSPIENDAGGFINNCGGTISATIIGAQDVPNCPPIVSFTKDPNPAQIDQTVTFDALGTLATDGDSIQEYFWDFDDDGFHDDASGVMVINSFETSGTFPISLQVKESSGQMEFGSMDLIILADMESSQVIGGKIIPIESASLLLASTQSFSWMIPVVLSVLGIGLVLVRRK